MPDARYFTPPDSFVHAATIPADMVGGRAYRGVPTGGELGHLLYEVRVNPQPGGHLGTGLAGVQECKDLVLLIHIRYVTLCGSPSQGDKLPPPMGWSVIIYGE